MITISGGNKKIVILSQILPYFQNAEMMFRRNFADLLNDFSFEIYDSLAFLQDSNIQMAEYAKNFLDIIKKSDVDIFIGFSFGGAILQNLATLIPKDKKIILISTPSIISAELKSKLEHLIDLLNKKEKLSASKALHHFIARNSQTPLPVEDYDETAIKRLIFGFETLLTHKINKNYLNVFNLYGELSRLVTKDDIFPQKNPNNFQIPESGMRIFDDNNNYVINLLKKLAV